MIIYIVIAIFKNFLYYIPFLNKGTAVKRRQTRFV